MSADSQHRSKSQSRCSGDPVTVSPQQVTDPTILDSVAGFINDVVPNAYNVPGDCKDQIQWAHFEQLDDYIQSGDIENSVAQPLILVLGYTNGIQVFYYYFQLIKRYVLYTTYFFVYLFYNYSCIRGWI